MEVHGFLPEVRGLRALVQGFHAGVVPLHLGLMNLGGSVRRFYFVAGAGLGHSCRRSRWEALRRRAPADSYCPAILKNDPVVILNEAQLQCSIARLRALPLPLGFPGTEGSRSLIMIVPFDGARYRNPAVGFHRRIFIRARAASACEPAAHRIPERRNPGYPRG